MPEVIIDDYLASEESVVKRWSGEITGSKPSGGGEFAATDRRIALLTEDGDFKDIAYNHVISVESEINDPADSMRYLPWIAIGIGGWFSVGALSAINEGNIGGFVGLLVGALVLLWLAIKGFDTDWEEVNDQPVSHEITLVTGDEREDQLTFKTTENVSALLSQKIRD